MAGSEQLKEMDIFAEQFPDDVSISALCDCGRCKRIHNQTTYKPPTRAPLPETDYRATFKMLEQPRPRSSKRPPQTPLNPNPAPMTFETNQRREFKSHGNVERVKPIVQEEHYKPPEGPMATTTYYTQEFTAKQALEPLTLPVAKRETLRVPTVPFASQTTNKETFKPWVQQPSIAFGELPSFTGSILFPERKPLPESTMRHSFQGVYKPPVPPIKAGTPNIKLEGGQNFDTTHKETYKETKGDHRAKPLVPKATTPTGKRGKFNGETQFMRDFPGYKGRQPLPPAPAEPAPTTIDLKFDNKRSFSTENRTTFKGHNVVEHPAPVSCKAVEGDYKPPEVKFETETSQKRDYKPIDLHNVETVKAVMPPTTMAPAQEAHFDGRTMNNEFFKNWGASPRIRYGDFHENRPYIPPTMPFEGESITKTSFVKKQAQPVTLYKPAERPNSKANAKVDYSTSYTDEFQKKQVRMCRAKMYLLQQEMKRRQRAAAAMSGKAISVK